MRIDWPKHSRRLLDGTLGLLLILCVAWTVWATYGLVIPVAVGCWYFGDWMMGLWD